MFLELRAFRYSSPFGELNSPCRFGLENWAVRFSEDHSRDSMLSGDLKEAFGDRVAVLIAA